VVLVITVDARRKKLLSAAVYVEGRGHSEARTAVNVLANIREKGKRVKGFYGDGAYDANLVFFSLKEADSAVEIMTNATTYRSRLREEGMRLGSTIPWATGGGRSKRIMEGAGPLRVSSLR